MTARRALCAAVPGFLLALAAYSEASAEWVGDRFFPSTLATTVPTPADFFNPPNFVLLPETAATPSAREIDIPTTYSKLITPDWAVTFAETFRILEQANTPTRQGFDNFVLGTQYQLYTNAEHQFVFTVGGTAALGGSGSSNIANSFSTLTPTVFIGKGFGDLPDSMAWLRPVIVTANLGVALTTQSTTLFTRTLPAGATAVTETVNPNILLWSFALEYSLLTTSYSGGDRKGRRIHQGWWNSRCRRRSTGRSQGRRPERSIRASSGWTDISRSGWRRSFRSMRARAATSACAHRPTYIFPRCFPTRSASRSSATERTPRDA
jgi:hypothetical protein